MMELLRKSAAHVFIDSLANPQLSNEDQHHLLKALRITDRDIISVSDGRGSWVQAKLLRNGDIQPISEVFTSTLGRGRSPLLLRL